MQLKDNLEQSIWEKGSFKGDWATGKKLKNIVDQLQDKKENY